MASIFPNKDLQQAVFSWLDAESLSTAEQVCQAWRTFVASSDAHLWAPHLHALSPKPAAANSDGYKWQPQSDDDGYKSTALAVGQKCRRFFRHPAIVRANPFSPEYHRATARPLPTSEKSYKTAYAIQLFLITQALQYHRRVQLLYDLLETKIPEAIELVGETFWWTGIDEQVKTGLVSRLAAFNTPQTIALFKKIHDTLSDNHFQYAFLGSAMDLGMYEYYPEYLPFFYKETKSFDKREVERALKTVGGLAPALDFVDPKSSGEPSMATRLANLYKDGKTAEWTKAWALDHLFPLDPSQAIHLFFATPANSRVEVAVKKHFKTVDAAVLVPILKQIVLDSDKPNQCRWTAAAKLLGRDKAGLTPEELSQIPDYKFPLDPAISEEVRAALVRWWAPSAEAGSDPRWLIEAAIAGAAPHPVHETDWDTLTAVATEALGGVPVLGPVECWELHGTGGGNFKAAKINCFSDRKDTAELQYYKQVLIFASNVAPYAAIHINTGVRAKNSASGSLAVAPSSEVAKMKAPGAKLATQAAAIAAFTKGATEAGLTVLSSQELDAGFAGLNVYYLGDRRQLTVGELMFYWQD